MKTRLFFLFALLFSVSAIAQDTKTNIAVSYFDTKGISITTEQAGSIARSEITKMGKFEIMDEYDMISLLEEGGFDIKRCLGKTCLIKAGKTINVDKFLTGSIEQYGNKINIQIRLIDIATKQIEKTEVAEFLDLPDQVSNVIRLTLEKMFDVPSDQKLLQKLTKEDDYYSSVNAPSSDRLELSGPRMGLTFASGEAGDIFRAPKSEGGFDVNPVLLQFGYQFEVMYLNQGDFQALFEFIPVVTGFDQGLFIPSFSILNGIRDNNTGWEVAFGPIFYISREARGYYDEAGTWNLENAWYEENPNEDIPFEVVKRLDSRGNLLGVPSFVVAIGKTFKSGKLNIPVNAFFIPNSDGHRFGISVGFNTSSFGR